MYIYIYIYIYLSTYIRRPLQSVERVRLHLLAYNIQPFPSPTHRSKAQKRTSVQPAQVARQLKSRNPTLQAAGNQDLGARMVRSYHLIILSSFIGDLLARNRLPQGATGCPRFWPRIQQISLNRCSRLHRTAKWLSWVPWLLQWSPNGTRTLQQTPEMAKALQNVNQIRVKSATSQAERQASKHPCLGSQRSAAEAVAFSIYRQYIGNIYIYIYIT